MKRYLSIAGLTAVVVFAISAVGAASASATEPVWIVNKAVLKAGEEKLYRSEQDSVKLLKAAGVHIDCELEKDAGALIGGRPGTDTVTEAVYTKCKVLEPAGCTVVEPITLNATPASPIRTTLAWKHSGKPGEANPNGEVLDRFQPKEGTTTFVEITLENCGLATGKHAVTGEVLAEVGHLNTAKEFVKTNAFAPEEVVEGALNFPCPPLTEYWTGDEPNRVKHTIKPLEFLGIAEYCEVTKIWLVNALEERTNEPFGVTAE